MTTPDFLQQLILSIPNFAIAVLALYWASARLDKCYDNQQKLIDALLLQVQRNQALSDKLHSNGG
jgi:hypothetical protein